MARVQRKKASRDYPEIGVKRGEEYYTWALYRQPVRRSKTYPPRSATTGSEFLSRLYDFVDDRLKNCANDDDLRSLAEEVRELVEDERAKVDDLPENFQQAGPGEKLATRADEAEGWADELESAADELGSEDDFKPEDDDHATYAEALAAKLDELDGSAPDPE